jgi:RNA polymerase sigma factor (sigma-70 family)
MTDRELLERIAAKDSQSFKVFYDRYCNLLNGWAYSRLNDREAASDVMQEFWAYVWLTPQSIRPDETDSVKHYLVRNVSFRILKYFHKQSVKIEIADDELVARQIPVLSYTHVQEEVDAKEIQQLIDDVLLTLPILSRQIYELRCIKDFSVKETASKLGVAESTVRNGLSSVVSTLRNEVTLRYETSGSGKLKALLPLLTLLGCGVNG